MAEIDFNNECYLYVIVKDIESINQIYRVTRSQAISDYYISEDAKTIFYELESKGKANHLVSIGIARNRQQMQSIQGIKAINELE